MKHPSTSQSACPQGLSCSASTSAALVLLLATLACSEETSTSSTDSTGATDSETEGSNATEADCTQASHFLDVSTGSAGEGYPSPELEVACSDSEVIVTSNGIPNFTFVATTPNALTEQHHVFTFPREPSFASQTTAVPLTGFVAVTVSGLPIFGPTEAPQDGYRDPYLDGLLDYCNGHTAPGGVYHFHARPDCLFTDLEGNTSLVVAYAFDGYPILAPYACEDDECTQVEELESSFQKVEGQWSDDGDPLYVDTTEGSWDVYEYVEGSGDLDECNGRELPGGGYAYYATSKFPYFIGCYRGIPTANDHTH